MLHFPRTINSQQERSQLNIMYHLCEIDFRYGDWVIKSVKEKWHGYIQTCIPYALTYAYQYWINSDFACPCCDEHLFPWKIGRNLTAFFRSTKFCDLVLFNGITSNSLIISVLKKKEPRKAQGIRLYQLRSITRRNLQG